MGCLTNAMTMRKEATREHVNKRKRERYRAKVQRRPVVSGHAHESPLSSLDPSLLLGSIVENTVQPQAQQPLSIIGAVEQPLSADCAAHYSAHKAHQMLSGSEMVDVGSMNTAWGISAAMDPLFSSEMCPSTVDLTLAQWPMSTSEQNLGPVLNNIEGLWTTSSLSDLSDKLDLSGTGDTYLVEYKIKSAEPELTPVDIFQCILPGDS